MHKGNTPDRGVSLLVGGWGGEPCAALSPVNPPANRYSMPCWQGGELPPVTPPVNRDSVPCWRVGLLGGAPHPPTSRETPLSGVLPLCTVGTFQLPRSQKQTSSSLPPHSMFLTAVTAMPPPANITNTSPTSYTHEAHMGLEIGT